MTVRELITKLGFKVDEAKVNKFNKAMNNTKQRMGGVKDKFSGIISQIPGLSGIGNIFSSATPKIAAMAAAIGAVIVATKKMIQTFIQFDEGMKGIERVTLASRKEMDLFQETALRVGESSVFTSKQAATAMQYLAQAGLTVQETIKAVANMLQLAAAGNLDLANAAKISTRIMRSNKLAVEDLVRVNDVLVKTQATSLASVESLGEAFSTLGNMGALSGLQIEELSAIFGILADNGMEGTIAGTLFRNALTRILSPAKKTTDFMSQMGIDLANFTDETGKFRKEGLVDLLEMMNKALAEGRVKAVDFTKFFGERAGRAIVTLASQTQEGDESLRAYIQTMLESKGIAKDAADVAFKGLSGAIKEFKSRMEVAANRFMIESGFAKVIEEFVRFFSDIIPPLIIMVGRILKPVFLPLLFALKLLRPITKAFRFLFEILNAILKFGFLPIKAVLMVINYIIDTIRANWESFVEYVKKTFIGKLLMDIKNFFTDMIDWIIGKINLLIDNLNKLPIISKNKISRIDPLREVMNNTKNTMININQRNNITGINNGSEIVGNIEDQTRAIFQIELQKLFVAAGF